MKQEYFAHETAGIDANCRIGEGTKIWHFSHERLHDRQKLQYRPKRGDLPGSRAGK